MYIYFTQQQLTFLEKLYNEVSLYCNTSFNQKFLTFGKNSAFKDDIQKDVEFASFMLNVKVEFPYV